MPVFSKVLTALPRLALGAACLSLLACATTDTAEDKPREPLVRQVTQSAHCGLTGPGVAYVEGATELQKLLELPAQNMAVEQLRQVDLEHEHLLFVTLGKKPTGGYSVRLDSARNTKGNLQLSMSLRTPEAGDMVTQAITSPCAVVAVQGAGWPEIRVSGVRDNDIVVTP